MKTHQLMREQIEALLQELEVGTLALINEDGSPYTVPMHFVWYKDAFYFHGLKAGKKIDNIKNNPQACFNTYKMGEFQLPENGVPCDTNTAYQSVTTSGTISLIDDIDFKREVLNAIVNKFTPSLAGAVLPENMVKGTAVIELKPKEITGKYWE